MASSVPQPLPTVPVQATPVATPTETSNVSTEPATTSNEDAPSNEALHTFKSPIIGTFYRKPSPDKENFVKVGDSVEEGTVLCIIEAMKLFNEIECDIKGKVVKILVDEASPVEYDQPLFLIDTNQ